MTGDQIPVVFAVAGIQLAPTFTVPIKGIMILGTQP